MNQRAAGARSIPEPVIGAMAGMVAIIIFTIVHDVLISNIWYMLIPMAILGGVCGSMLAWLHTRMPEASWWGLNVAYVGSFGVLGALSVAAFDPVTTVIELSALNGPPDQLIGDAIPLTIGFTVTTAVLVTRVFGRWRDLPAVLATSVVLVVTLGLNISVIGFVDFRSGGLGVALFFFALVALIAITFAGIHSLLMRLAASDHRLPSIALQPNRP